MADALNVVVVGVHYDATDRVDENFVNVQRRHKRRNADHNRQHFLSTGERDSEMRPHH